MENITIKDTIIIDIGNSHINLKNIYSKYIIVKSAGLNSVNFLENSTVENLIINTTNPVKINAGDNSNIKIDNIILAPTSNTLEKSTILLDGDFSNSNIIVENSLALICGDNFKTNKPIIINLKDNINQLNFSGIFLSVPKIIAYGNMVIIGNTQNPPISLKIELESEEASNISLKGNLLTSDIIFNSSAIVNCDANIGNIQIKNSAKEIDMNVSSTTSFNSIKNDAILDLEGEENLLNTVISNTHNTPNGSVLIKALQQIINFTNGQGSSTIKISKSGNFSFTVKVLAKNNKRVINDNLTVTII
ncbi:MAG: hypothetical protein ACERKV_03660 [Clostridiaceae bacterium]